MKPINKMIKQASLIIGLSSLCTVGFAQIPDTETGYVGGATDTIQIFGNLWVEKAINTGGTSSSSVNPVGIQRFSNDTMHLYSEDDDRMVLRFACDAPADTYLGDIMAREDGHIGMRDKQGSWFFLTQRTSSTAAYTKIYAAGAEMARIQNLGGTKRIGFLTNNPQTDFHVAGVGRFDNDLSVFVNGQADFTIWSNNTTSDSTLRMRGGLKSWVFRNDNSEDHALSIRSQTDGQGESPKLIIQQDGDAEFKGKVTIEAGGDIPMGNYTSKP